MAGLTVSQYKPGFTLGANGHLEAAQDVMAQKIPQLHALLKILADSEWTWNDEIKMELICLAAGVAKDIHEAHEESIHDVIVCERNKRRSPPTQHADAQAYAG